LAGEKTEIVEIDYEGSLFETIYDIEGGFYYCPLCGDSDGSPIFFKKSDLINHILNHFTERR
jgi:hypothetical protein